ncbi:MAG: hypothetical protein WAU89_22135 [Candidatus Acidiferrales bacterium]
MGGLVIDIVLAFLFKSSVRAFRFVKSLRWKRSTAVVVDSTLLDLYMGCPSVKVHYQVVSNESRQQGSDELPFYLRASAKRYAQSLSGNLAVIVRTNPSNQREMLFFPYDQHSSSVAAGVR